MKERTDRTPTSDSDDLDGSVNSGLQIGGGADEWFIDTLPRCKESGVGRATNVEYHHGGQQMHVHDLQDVAVKFCDEERGIAVYVVIDAHNNGRSLAEFAVQKLVHEIYFESQIHAQTPDREVRAIIRNAFLSVDEGYFNTLGDKLARRAELRERIAGIKLADANTQQPQTIAELEQNTVMISGGATAALAIMLGDRLFIANVGNCRALLCRASESTGQLTVTQLSAQHDVDNKDEYLRLRQLGLSDAILRSNWAFRFSTRCLGDYRVKDGYKEDEQLAEALSEPHIAEPDIHGPFHIDRTYRFLLLMTSGVYSAWEAATSSQQANADIVGQVAGEFSLQSTISLVSQAVVDHIGRIHSEAYQIAHRSHLRRREDMTILVRNFSQCLARQQPGHESSMFDTVFNHNIISINTNQAKLSIPSHYSSATPFGVAPNFAEEPDNTLTQNSELTLRFGADGDSDDDDELSGGMYGGSDELKRLEKWPINADGRLEAYVDFSEYYRRVAEYEAKKRREEHKDNDSSSEI